MSAARQLKLAQPGSTLPIDPRTLVGMSPIERGRVYNFAGAGLTAEQRRAVEEALRMVQAGDYPAASRAAAVEHLRRERTTREALGRSGRNR